MVSLSISAFVIAVKAWNDFQDYQAIMTEINKTTGFYALPAWIPITLANESILIIAVGLVLCILGIKFKNKYRFLALFSALLSIAYLFFPMGITIALILPHFP